VTSAMKSSATGSHDTKALLHILSDQMETVLWTTDAGLRVTSFVGGKPGHPMFAHDPVGRPVGELFGGRTAAAIPLEAHDRALRGETVAFDMSRGDECYEAYVEPLRDDAGAIVGCVGVAMSVSRPAARADAGRDMRRRPSWGVDYDFNVLISLIQGYSRLTLNQMPLDDPLRDALMGIVRASDRAAAVLRGDGGLDEGPGCGAGDRA
jgi:hypothetical protein